MLLSRKTQTVFGTPVHSAHVTWGNPVADMRTDHNIEQKRKLRSALIGWTITTEKPKE